MKWVGKPACQSIPQLSGLANVSYPQQARSGKGQSLAQARPKLLRDRDEGWDLAAAWARAVPSIGRDQDQS